LARGSYLPGAYLPGTLPAAPPGLAPSGPPRDGRILVTGGAGFIGRRVVGALLAAGHQVTVADLRRFPADGGQRVRDVTGDLCDPEVASRAVTDDTTAIIHLAAVTSVLRSIDDPVQVHMVNVDVTARLLELAREHSVGSFLFASTNAVTGNVGQATISEQAVLRPLTPYGATKAAGEMLISAYANCYGIKGCSLRFSNVYGPGMAEKDSFIPRLMRAARDADGVQVRGDGGMLRDVVHVDDVVAGISVAWQAGHTGPLIVAGGKSVTVMDMVRAARRVTGAPIPVSHVPVGPGEMPAVVVDISAARALGYQPTMDLDAGLSTVWPEFDPARAPLPVAPTSTTAPETKL
jgi:UDP-glucose 4-epimerase